MGFPMREVIFSIDQLEILNILSMRQFYRKNEEKHVARSPKVI